MKHPEWNPTDWAYITPEVRKQTLERAGADNPQQFGTCEDCRDETNLEQLHHECYSYEYSKHFTDPNHYYKRGWHTPGYEHINPDELAALYRRCHHARHIDENGEFWDDPVEMREHWEPYYWEMEKD
jgi:hypothetical protein